MSDANEVRDVLLTPPPHASPAAGICASGSPGLLYTPSISGSAYCGFPAFPSCFEPPGEKAVLSAVLSHLGPPVMLAGYASNEGSPSL